MSVINIFKKGSHQLFSGIDTWTVEWTCRYGRYYGDTKQCYKHLPIKMMPRNLPNQQEKHID